MARVAWGAAPDDEVLVAEAAWWWRGDCRSGVDGACPIARRGERHRTGFPFHRRLSDRSAPPENDPGGLHRTDTFPRGSRWAARSPANERAQRRRSGRLVRGTD